MVQESVLIAATVLLGCSCKDSHRNEKPVVTHDLPSEAMATIPSGEYLATGPLLPPFESCTAEMRRQLDKLVLDEQPQARQTVAAFAIDKQRVSCRDFLECVRQNGCEVEYHTYDDLRRDDRVVCANGEAHVSVENAEAYCAWRGRQLPTFLQWQVAARGRDGAPIVDAKCVERADDTVCEAISSFGVLVSAPSHYLAEELTRSMDCFPVKLMGYREGDDELGRVRTVAVTRVRQVDGKPKLLLDEAAPETVILDNNRKLRGSQYFRCASDVPSSIAAP